MASFPWDPKPDPPQPPVAALADASAQAQQSLEPALALPGAGSNGAKPEPVIKQEPEIKQEPGISQTAVPLPHFNGVDNKNSIAASRAAQQLQAQYGNRAAGSINAIRDGMNPQAGSQSQQDPSGYDGSNGQTDGAGDTEGFEGVLMKRAANGDLKELGRVEIDQMVHDRILANAKAMEGGGLMLPLREASRHQTAKADRKGKGKAVTKYDGEDDEDDEFDEDAINSDLDDPEEDHVDEDEGDEGLGHIMLCMYDKVQRVKNKWYDISHLLNIRVWCMILTSQNRKCILKDGVLTVNGKEYVFHKATGEFEW